MTRTQPNAESASVPVPHSLTRLVKARPDQSTLPQRFTYVDLLRGLAALAVLITHYRWFFARSVGDWRTDVQLPLYDVLWPFYENGLLAVQMFWILSGFVFTVAYGGFGRNVSARTFLIHRVARLYPLHFITLLLVAILQTISWKTSGEWQIYGNNDVRHFIAHLGFASNWFTTEHSFNAPVWSVSIEVLIYAAFLVYLLRSGPNLWVAIAIIPLAFIAERLTQNFIPQCFALFFAGVVIARIAQRVQSWAIFVSGLGLLIVTIAGVALGEPMALVYAGTPALLLLFVGLDLTFPPVPQGLHWIGAITYAVYLLHMPVLISLKMSFGTSLPLESPGMLGAFLALVVLISIPVYRHLELPSQRYIRRLASRD